MTARWARVLPGLWAGLLLCIALIATPAVFAVLPAADAGPVVARIFVQEAGLSLVLAAALLLAERRRRTQLFDPARRAGAGNKALLWATVLCTLVGYFAVQWLLPSARAGQGPLSFGQLHGVSVVCYGIKTLAVLVLAWRAASAA
jgi:hypothetical protein